jgi:hypothetical protein
MECAELVTLPRGVFSTAGGRNCKKVDAAGGCESGLREGYLASEPEIEGSVARVAALAAVAALACGLALLPAAVAARLIPSSGAELAAVLGGATAAIGALKVLALIWSVVGRWWPEHPAGLANLHRG